MPKILLSKIIVLSNYKSIIDTKNIIVKIIVLSNYKSIIDAKKYYLAIENSSIKMKKFNRCQKILFGNRK